MRRVLCAVLAVLAAGPSEAASTWLGGTGVWTDSANWTGGVAGSANNVVQQPDGSWLATGEDAVFSNAGTTTVDVRWSDSYSVAVNNLTFDPGANAYSMNLNARTTLTVTGGITNSSGNVQTFNTFTDYHASSAFKFLGNATMGTNTVFNMVGGEVWQGWGTQAEFWGNSTAGSATINHYGGIVYNSNGGGTFFRESSSAGASTINNYGADVEGGGGGAVLFWDTATAGSSTITMYGGTTAGAGGGSASFWDNTNAGTATLVLMGGTNGGNGAGMDFIDNAQAGQATIKLSGNAVLDVGDTGDYFDGPKRSTINVGSIEGEGAIYIGDRTLSVGGLNKSTTFAGVIIDPDPFEEQEFNGNLTKVGAGTFTLTGASTYSGKTTVNGGTLRVGTGGSIISAVTVNNGGTFGGDGTVGNSVTVNSGGTLAPGGEAITKISGAVTFKTGAKSTMLLDGPGTADGARMTTAGEDYDQVALGGGLTIQSGVGLVIDATNLTVNSAFVVGQPNVLAANYFLFNLTAAGSTPGQTGVFVTGTFATLNGVTIVYSGGFGTVTVDGRRFAISYQGDYATNSTTGGNDVVLSAITVPEPSSFALVMGGAGLLLGLRRRLGWPHAKSAKVAKGGSKADRFLGPAFRD